MLHVYIPEILTDSFRVLPKWCRKFHIPKLDSLEQALAYGYDNCPQGFRVFRQRTCELYGPLSTEVAKIANRKSWIVDKENTCLK